MTLFFFIFTLLSWSHFFHAFIIKLILFFYFITYLTSWVFNVIQLGPDEALMFFVL